MATFAVDTHALVWWITGDPRAGAGAREALDGPANVLSLSVIVLAEACWIVERGRTAIPSPAALMQSVHSDRRFRVIPLTRPILERSLALTAVGEMHDRLIVATALHLSARGRAVPLLTRDANITAFGLLDVVW